MLLKVLNWKKRRIGNMAHSTAGVITAACYFFRRVKVRKRISLTWFKVALIEMKGATSYDR